jgi:hypothetical protein
MDLQLHAPLNSAKHIVCRSQWQLGLSRSSAAIVSSNPTGGMDVCLLCVLCVVR